MSKELEDLVGDVAEYAEYCGELGYGPMEVDLPPVRHTEAAARLPKLAPKAPEVIEKYIPEELPLPAPRPTTQDQPARTSRLGLLEQSRLSKLTGQKMPQRETGAKRESAPADTVRAASEPAAVTEVSAALPQTGENIGAVREDIGACTRCALCEGRTQIVHSIGDLGAKLMFVGEAPGADEDLKGEPFVGRAGQLLTKIIEAIGLTREQVFIGNINRCRPPGNRPPTLPEAEACKPFLLREIAIVKPKVIVVLGNTACQNLLNTKVGISKLRGNFQDYFGVKVMPTFHPAYLLRDPHKKKEVWEDMKKVRDYLNTV